MPEVVIRGIPGPGGARAHGVPRFVPDAGPRTAPGNRWHAATGFEPFRVDGSGVRSADTTAALDLATGLAEQAVALANEAALKIERASATEPGDQSGVAPAGPPQTSAATIDETYAKSDGLHMLAAEMRREAGDWVACAGNYRALTKRYLAARDFRPALAFMRRLVSVADLSGSKSLQADAYLLAAETYRAVGDHVPATVSANQAAKLAVELADIDVLDRAMVAVADIRAALVSRTTPDPTCACGSQLPYAECCKAADQVPAEFAVRATGLASSPFHPASSPWLSGGRAGIDVMMESPGPSGEASYWVEHGISDGSHTLRMFPNFPARAMQAARAMHAYSLKNVDGFEGPASTVLQVGCALDAFINAVLYFMNFDEGARFWTSKVPLHRFKTGPGKNGGGLHERWKEVGGGLLGEAWTKASRMEDLELLAQVRTALVHYKEDNIEQIAPVPGSPHRFVAAFEEHDDFALPGAIRPGPAPWIDRLLTPHMAGWAVSLGEEMITGFREAWLAANAAYETVSHIDDGAGPLRAAGT